MDECLICLEGLPGVYPHQVCGCGHTFHDACLRQWVIASKTSKSVVTCPACRASSGRRRIVHDPRHIEYGALGESHGNPVDLTADGGAAGKEDIIDLVCVVARRARKRQSKRSSTGAGNNTNSGSSADRGAEATPAVRHVASVAAESAAAAGSAVATGSAVAAGSRGSRAAIRAATKAATKAASRAAASSAASAEDNAAASVAHLGL